EHKLMNAAAKVWPHHAFTRSGFKNDEDRLPDVLFVSNTRNETRTRVERDRHGPATAQEVFSFRCEIAAHPIITVVAPLTIGSGGPTSTTVPPRRAAGRPPIITVMLPTATTPPTCGFGPSDNGQICESERARQAGCPPIKTVRQPGPGLSGLP